MSYANFKSRVWAAAIQRDLAQKSVFAEDCNHEFEGEVKNVGDSIRVLGVGKPTIHKQTGGSITLDGAEHVEDTSSTLLVDHVAYYDFEVGDIDKAQSTGNVMSALRAEATEGLAGAMDEDIAALAKDKLAPKLQSNTLELTSSNVLGTFQAAMQKLLENNVSTNTEVIANIPPWIWMLLFDKLTALDTDNSKRIRTVNLGRYGMCTFKCTNTTAYASSVYYPMVRTKRAISAVVAKTYAEAYRPEKKFADALKGYALYGQKIQRPKEMVVIPCAPASN